MFCKVKSAKKNFFFRGDFWQFSNTNIQIWDHFFPLLFPKDSESLKILYIRLRKVGGKRRLISTSKVNTHTDGQTDRRTFRLIESIGPEGRWFELPDQHLSVWLFSNPGDKVQILVESTAQNCPVVLHLCWTLSPGFENKHTFKCWSGIFPTILTYMIMLEDCQNNISVYGCSPIKGTKLSSCWNLMKPGSQSGTSAYRALPASVNVP